MATSTYRDHSLKTNTLLHSPHTTSPELSRTGKEGLLSTYTTDSTLRQQKQKHKKNLFRRCR